MNKSALEDALNFIHSINLTAEEKIWLASQLSAEATRQTPVVYGTEGGMADILKEETPMEPYTMTEINARLDEAEREFESGEGIDNEDVFREAWEHMYKVQSA